MIFSRMLITKLFLFLLTSTVFFGLYDGSQWEPKQFSYQQSFFFFIVDFDGFNKNILYIVNI